MDDAVTNDEGIATIYYTPQNTGEFNIEVRFNGDSNHNPSMNTGILTVTDIPKPIDPDDPVDPDDNTTETSNNPTASAVMKENGIPINLILLVLLSLIGLGYYRKQ